MIAFLVAIQQSINDAIGGYVGAFASTGDWFALFGVMPLGIVFGAVHALTPGHSKTLLASYLVGSPHAIVRGLTVSSVLSATHVASAVVIALLAAELLSRTLVGAGRAPAIENISRSLLVLVGFWFVFRAIRGDAHRPKREGVAIGFIAGLVPCPLTLFVMVLALSRGVPEAGLVFAGAMMIGVAITLGAVAVLTVLARATLTAALKRFGASVYMISRGLDGTAGLFLILLGASALVS